MAGEISTGGGPADADRGAGPFVRALSPDDPDIGGKARSLARLASLGLPTPPGFALSRRLWTALGAPLPLRLPSRLTSVEDLDLLDHGRQAVLEAPFPPGFMEELTGAIARLRRLWSSRPIGGVRPGGATSYAVRSSSPGEDRPGALAPGVFESELRVGRAGVAAAVRRVLASSYLPAAWAYGVRQTEERSWATPLAVLVHPFIHGDAVGAAAWDGSRESPLIAVARGALDPRGRRAIDHGTRRAGEQFGSVEVEWVAAGEEIVFLQMRPYRIPVAPHDDERAAWAIGGTDRPGLTGESEPAGVFPSPSPSTSPCWPWRWDSAHNPDPLSAAQAGLVEWVDQVCSIGIRQRVVDRYLFWRPAEEPSRAAAESDRDRALFSRAAFDSLVATSESWIGGLGPDHSGLEPALDFFSRAYQTLFGDISPGRARARDLLAAALRESFPRDRAGVEPWLAGVRSAATARLAAAKDIAMAGDADDRRAAVARYLEGFGDESPCWDVAEPTWRERPERLLLLAGLRTENQGARRGSPGSPKSPGKAAPSSSSGAAASDLGGMPAGLQARLDSLPPETRRSFGAKLQAAREAAAVREDDDALFARLQAVVRRSLLTLGERWFTDGRLASPDDVFHLPLHLARALAGPPEGPLDRAPGSTAGMVGTPEALDLKAVAAAGKLALEGARARRPPLVSLGADARPSRPTAAARGPVLRGLPGAPGRVIGIAVHHPSWVPLRAGSILIASTLLPMELPLVFPSGIVTETGSPLDHVAAQARERDIPAVVGVPRALASIRPGAAILLDGERGEIVFLDDEGGPVE